MKLTILFDISHPAHLHFFRNSILKLDRMGVQCLVVARDKDITLDLFDYYGLNKFLVYKISPLKSLFGFLNIFFSQIICFTKLFRSYKIHCCLGIQSEALSIAAKFFSIPCLVFTDTESAVYTNFILSKFSSTVFTPQCYLGSFGIKHKKYNGYHELAYLHPNNFTPDLDVLKSLGIKDNEKYIIFRFVSWKALHDLGQSGFTLRQKFSLISKLNKNFRVFISSEGDLPNELESYKIPLLPNKIHDALFYASLYIGEGATMASESVVLGTPAIYVNTLTAGTIIDQQNRFELLNHFNNHKGVLNKALEILSLNNHDTENIKNQNIVISSMIDVTDFIVRNVKSFSK